MHAAASIGFNVFVTLAIVSRMLYFRKRAITSLGKQHARVYAGIAAMFIESGTLYTSLFIIHAIFIATESWMQNLFAQALRQVIVSKQVHTGYY